MSMFVSQEGVPVSVDSDDTPAAERNTIWVKEKMDVGTQNRMLSAMVQIREQSGDVEGTRMTYDLGAYNLALLKYNIVRWEGPEFSAMPCTPENIERLDPDNPLVVAVLERLNELNTERARLKKAKSPNGVRPTGSRSSEGARSRAREASGTCT